MCNVFLYNAEVSRAPNLKNEKKETLVYPVPSPVLLTLISLQRSRSCIWLQLLQIIWWKRKQKEKCKKKKKEIRYLTVCANDGMGMEESVLSEFLELTVTGSFSTATLQSFLSFGVSHSRHGACVQFSNSSSVKICAPNDSFRTARTAL